ncbi:MAG TPA: formate dehydrogenase accessory sulfurtransferase FdhD [Candidatus Thermoplasmatota archaeon]|nr:formate dehydrogenase accessory sulfurtransferase FdhD [Candidatus Thermoplasmatota archaeon]
MDPRKPFAWRRFADGSWKEESGSVPAETRVAIELNDEPAGTIWASPHEPDRLALGHLLLEGWSFDAPKARAELLESDGGVVARVHAPGAVPPREAPLPPAAFVPPYAPASVVACVAGMQREAKIYSEGGGVHAAALFWAGNLRYLAEDVGKLNTLARLAAAKALDGRTRRALLLCCTGRVTGAMARRAALLHAPVVVTLSSPTAEGVSVCRAAGITLAGYARGKGFNVYVGDRIAPVSG